MKDGNYTESANSVDKRTLRELASPVSWIGRKVIWRNLIEMRQCLWDRPTHEQNTWRTVQALYEWTHVSLEDPETRILLVNYGERLFQTRSKMPSLSNICSRSTSPMNNMTSPWPFSMWGIDAIGMIQPKASNGYRFILVAINYFTKWVLHLQTLRRHKLPASSDKTASVNTACPNPSYKQRSESQHDMMESLCAQFKIYHQKSTP